MSKERSLSVFNYLMGVIFCMFIIVGGYLLVGGACYMIYNNVEGSAVFISMAFLSSLFIFYTGFVVLCKLDEKYNKEMKRR